MRTHASGQLPSTPGPGVAVAFWPLVAGVLASACLGDEPIEFIELTAFSAPAESRAFLLPERRSTGGAALALGPVAGDVGRVTYTTDTERRAFLLDGDLVAGIASRRPLQPVGYLHLPLLDPTLDPPRVVDVPEVETTKWTSFRVYDAGECAILIPWQKIADLLAEKLDREFERAAEAEDPLYGAVRTSWNPENYEYFGVRVSPVLRMGATRTHRILDLDQDLVDVWARYDATQAGDYPFDCDDVRIQIRFEFGLERQPGSVEWVAEHGCPGPTRATERRVRPPSYDFAGTVPDPAHDGTPNPSVEVRSDFCTVTDTIASSVARTIRDALPGAVEHAIRDALLLPPSPATDITLYDPPECNCDSDCTVVPSGEVAALPPGFRHQCVEVDDGTRRECRALLEPDRVNVRPDGLQIVVSDGPEDPQSAWLHDATFSPFRWLVLCNPEQDGMPDDAPVSQWHGQMSAVDVPALQRAAW